jgi:class 3 adenylate cyclase/tetratricopeptide (TPR) repeat protein
LPLPPRAEPPAGERRQVTILFADFAGFTAFVHKEDVEDVREFMDKVWARLDAIIAAHGGVVEKHIGDAIMGVFGARQAREDDPVQAVRAALAMQASLAEFRPRGQSSPLQMRMGVHTGPVVVGPLSHSGEFVATGDAVNLASRLQQNAPPGGVLVSQDTYRQVFGWFRLRTMPPLTVKGRPEPVQTYLVVEAKPRAVAVQVRGIEGVTTEMIGRDGELAQLQEVLQTVIREGKGRMITVLGEAGIGKSCLQREFTRLGALLPERIRLFSSRGTVDGTGLPFALLRDVFSTRFEILESDPPALARSKFEQGFAGLTDPEPDPAAAVDGAQRAHFVGQLLGLDFSDRPALRGILKDNDQIRSRAFRYLAQFFASAARSGKMRAALLIADDLHWGDEGSLDLIEYVARACRDAPVMVLCLARPTLVERHPHWAQRVPGHTLIRLQPLSRPDSRTLVESLLRNAPVVPQALRELVVNSGEGIPLFIEETIKMLIDQKVILPGADQWQIEPGQLAVAQVPPTLTGILQARLDGLTAGERAVLQRAAVLGRAFWDRALEFLGQDLGPDGGAAEVAAALAGLRRKELIFRHETSSFAGAIEYAFKHELLRSVTYDNLLRKTRRQFHGRAAEWLMQAGGERSGEIASLVAAHFEQGERPLEAAEWYGRAGEQARRGYAPATAMESFRKALALVPDAPAADTDTARRQRLEWLDGLVGVLTTLARYAEALEACAELDRAAEAGQDPVARARAWNHRAFLNERLGKNRASVDCATRAEELARSAGEAGGAEWTRALLLKGWAYYRLANAPAVLALAEEALALCRRFDNRQGIATTCKLHGVAHLQLGQFREAAQFFREGQLLYAELGDRRNTAAMWSNLGETARLAGDSRAAVGLYEKALAIVRQIGHHESETIYLTNLSGAQLGLGHFHEAETNLRLAVSLTADPNSCVLSETCSFLSQACLGQGKLDEALQAAQRSLALARDSENDLYLGGAWVALGRVAAAIETRPEASAAAGAGAVPKPDACFAESLRVFEKMNAAAEQGRVLRAWGEYDLARRCADLARPRLERALAIFERLGTADEVQRTRNLL